MQKWVVICWALLALAGADECPDGGSCEDGQTCCNDPAHGYECCPFDQAECCGDHMHCCPGGTICDTATSSCVNATASFPWVERASADQPRLSKSFRMIKAYMGEEDDNICPDQSRCPPEFSCLRALTRFGCCPLAQGVPCSDGKHCCPEGHQCSSDSRSCIKTEFVTTVLCSDEVSECPGETTCCETPEGEWGCCPMPKAVCCDDKTHCCPEGTTCDVEHNKCISSSTKKEMPMWAKLPARMRAEWENQKEGEQVTAETPKDGGSEKVPEVTPVNPVPHSENEAAAGNDVPCDETTACQDGTTCCKTKEGVWACCPLPQAVCCDDHEHCCPSGTTCDRTSLSCLGGSGSTPMRRKQPAFATAAPTTAAPSAQSTVEATTQQNGDPRVKTSCQSATSGNDVPCDETTACQDGTTCCKTQEGGWACCPLPEAVCCDDFIHCCPKGKKCNLAAQTCDDNTLSVPWAEKLPAKLRQGANVGNVTCDSSYSCSDGFTCCKNKEGDWACCPLPQPEATTQQTGEEEKEPEEDEVMEEEEEEEEENKEVKGWIQCDAHTSCPQHTTCCFMALSQKWGCCPLPKAVCCADGNHCCPTHYKCNAQGTSCVRGEVVIPWYTKLPATTSVQADPSSVQCDGLRRCPEHTTCCRLSTGGWGCCPLQNAVCCPDKEHCCPQGYTCDLASDSCSKLIMLQLETVPLTPVYLPEHQPRLGPLKHRDVQCDEQSRCRDGETCCRMSAATWGCCPIPNAVCCSDMVHCCPTGYTCAAGGDCTQNTGPHWHNWHVFLANKKRALTV